MKAATCAECGRRILLTRVGGDDELWQHVEAEHRGRSPQVVQMPAVTFHEQALAAIRTKAITGRPFTIGHCHQLVSVPAPTNGWETARKDAEGLGWIVHHGFTRSIVESQNGSAVSEWIGTAKAREVAA